MTDIEIEVTVESGNVNEETLKQALELSMENTAQ